MEMFKLTVFHVKFSDEMELLVIYDNEIFQEAKGLRKEWGFSCLIDNGIEKVLFDTGGNGSILLGNMEVLGVDPSEIDKLVISHEHWDHNGGLKKLLPHLQGVDVYDLADRKLPSGLVHHRVDGPMEIADGVRTTGMLEGSPVNEQSMVLQGEEGLWVVAGCSHPGVSSILDSARKMGRVVGLLGGFHGMSDLDLLRDLDHIYPMHCTQKKEEILEEYPQTAKEGGVGTRISI